MLITASLPNETFSSSFPMFANKCQALDSEDCLEKSLPKCLAFYLKHLGNEPPSQNGGFYRLFAALFMVVQ
jgi:hypothetical protein